MVIYEKLQQRLPEFIIEPVTLNNLSKYENIFYVFIIIITKDRIYVNKHSFIKFNYTSPSLHI